MRPEPELMTVWDQTRFRRGEVPSLSSFPDDVQEPPEKLSTCGHTHMSSLRSWLAPLENLSVPPTTRR